MDSTWKQVWLCRCISRVYGTVFWAENQKVRRQSGHVSAERYTRLEHGHLVKLMFSHSTVLAADVREVPYHRRLASCRCETCLSDARSDFRQGYLRHRNGCKKRGQQRKRRVRAGLHRGDQTKTAGCLVLCVL